MAKMTLKKREIWIDSYLTPAYKVSSFGRVLSLKRIDNIGRIIREKILKPQTLPIGYTKYTLSISGSKIQVLGHRLVLLSFIGEHPIKKQCNHKNGIKNDNRLSNLEWVTNKGNGEHSSKNGLHCQGERVYCHKLSKNDVLNIRKQWNHGIRIKDIAKQYPFVSSKTVSKAARCVTWRSLCLNQK